MKIFIAYINKTQIDEAPTLEDLLHQLENIRPELDDGVSVYSYDRVVEELPNGTKELYLENGKFELLLK